MSTATAQIDAGAVSLHNGVCGRSWSLLRGTTEELWMGAPREEWLTSRSPEFHLEVDGAPLAALDCRSVAWSEHAGPGWAEVTATFLFEKVGVTVTTRLHGAVSVFERRLTVRNIGGQDVAVGRHGAEILPLDAERCQLVALDDSIAPRLSEAAGLGGFGIIRQGARNLLLGGSDASEMLYFAPNPKYCAVAGASGQRVAPSQAVLLQRTMTALYEGSTARAAQAIVGYFEAHSDAD